MRVAKKPLHPFVLNVLDFFALLQPCDYREVFERGGVAFHIAMSGEFAEETAHDFSAARFWKRVGKADVVGLGESSDFFCDPLA